MPLCWWKLDIVGYFYWHHQHLNRMGESNCIITRRRFVSRETFLATSAIYQVLYLIFVWVDNASVIVFWRRWNPCYFPGLYCYYSWYFPFNISYSTKGHLRYWMVTARITIQATRKRLCRVFSLWFRGRQEIMRWMNAKCVIMCKKKGTDGCNLVLSLLPITKRHFVCGM